jgi:hypothetical protein
MHVRQYKFTYVPVDACTTGNTKRRNESKKEEDRSQRENKNNTTITFAGTSRSIFLGGKKFRFTTVRAFRCRNANDHPLSAPDPCMQKLCRGLRSELQTWWTSRLVLPRNLWCVVTRDGSTANAGSPAAEGSWIDRTTCARGRTCLCTKGKKKTDLRKRRIDPDEKTDLLAHVAVDACTHAREYETRKRIYY